VTDVKLDSNVYEVSLNAQLVQNCFPETRRAVNRGHSVIMDPGFASNLSKRRYAPHAFRKRAGC